MKTEPAVKAGPSRKTSPSMVLMRSASQGLPLTGNRGPSYGVHCSEELHMESTKVGDIEMFCLPRKPRKRSLKSGSEVLVGTNAAAKDFVVDTQDRKLPRRKSGIEYSLVMDDTGSYFLNGASELQLRNQRVSY